MLLSLQWLIAQHTEIHRIGVAIVPSASHTTVASHFVTAHHLHLATDELLTLTQVGHRVFTQIMTDIHQQTGIFLSLAGARLGEMNAIERTSLRGGNLRTNAIRERRRIITQSKILVGAHLFLR